MIDAEMTERIIQVGRELRANAEIFIAAAENGDYELAVVTLMQINEASALDTTDTDYGIGHWMLATLHALFASRNSPPTEAEWMQAMKHLAFDRWRDAMDTHGVGPKAAAQRYASEWDMRQGVWKNAASPED